MKCLFEDTFQLSWNTYPLQSCMFPPPLLLVFTSSVLFSSPSLQFYLSLTSMLMFFVIRMFRFNFSYNAHFKLIFIHQRNFCERFNKTTTNENTILGIVLYLKHRVHMMIVVEIEVVDCPNCAPPFILISVILINFYSKWM